MYTRTALSWCDTRQNGSQLVRHDTEQLSAGATRRRDDSFNTFAIGNNNNVADFAQSYIFCLTNLTQVLEKQANGK